MDEVNKTPGDEYDVPMDLPGEQQGSKYSPTGPPTKHLNSKKILIVVVIIVAAGLLIVGITKLLGNKKQVSQTTPPTSQPRTEQPSTSDVPDPTANQTYKNDRMGLTLTYPNTWRVSETQDSGVRIESADFTYQTKDKGNVSGNFRIYIRTGAREVDGKYIGRGVAIQPSEKLTYTNPLPGQRKDTLLSQFGLDTTDNFAFFLIAGNFNLKKGESLGPNYGKEADAFIIGGGYSAKDLQDDLATNKLPTDSYNQTKAYKQALTILQSLQLR